MNKSILIFTGSIFLLFLFLGCNSLVNFIEGDYRRDVIPLTKEQLETKPDYGKPDAVQLTNKFRADEVWIYRKKVYHTDKINYVTVTKKFYFKGNTLVAKEP